MSYDDYDGPPEPSFDHEVTLNAEVRLEWNNEAVLQSVIKRVADMIYDDIKPQVSQAVTASLDDLANKAMLEMFDSEVQPTDKWGKPIGSSISIRATLQRDTEKWMTEIVDYKGRRGSDGYGDRHPRVHWLFEEALNGKKDSRGPTRLQKMIVATIKSVIGDVTEVVEATVREQARQALGLK